MSDQQGLLFDNAGQAHIDSILKRFDDTDAPIEGRIEERVPDRQSAALWASDASYLNDYAELV